MAMTEALAAWGSYDIDDPFAVFEQVRQLGPVHAVTLADGHSAWLVVSYEEARAALNDSRLSKDMHAALATGSGVVAEGLPGPDFARHMLTVDPPDHTRLRRLVSAAFSPRRVEAMRSHIQTITDDLLDDIANQGPDSRVDLVATFAFPLPFTVICELLGVPQQDRASLGEGFTKLLVPTSTPAEYAAAKDASDAVVAKLKALVEAKQVDPGDDLVSGLISARDGDERLDSQELLSTIFQLIVAGHDTTASLIGNSIVALFRNPTQLAQLRADPARIAKAVEEFLRYDAPVPHSTFRYTAAPVTLGGIGDPRRRTGHHLPGRGEPGHGPIRQPRAHSTSTGVRPATSPSDTAFITVSVRRWPAWRASWLSDPSCSGSRSSPLPYRWQTCTGPTATASSSAACPSCRSSPAPPSRGRDRDERSGGLNPARSRAGAGSTRAGVGGPWTSATLCEPTNCREYVALHHRLGVGTGDRLLDVACGAGLAVELAGVRGARCAGIDASPAPHCRGPGSQPRRRSAGRGHARPAVGATALSTSSPASGESGARPPERLTEVHRVLVPGGRVGLTVWGHIKASPGAWALAPFSLAAAPKVENQAAMVAFGRPGAGETFLQDAGFTDVERFDIPFVFEFADPELYARALASTGPAFEAMETVGEVAFLQAAVETGPREGPRRSPAASVRLPLWVTSPPSRPYGSRPAPVPTPSDPTSRASASCKRRGTRPRCSACSTTTYKASAT